jgi:hypothetical protein
MKALLRLRTGPGNRRALDRSGHLPQVGAAIRFFTKSLEEDEKMGNTDLPEKPDFQTNRRAEIDKISVH